MEGVYTEDSEVDCEFLDVSVEEQTLLEEINKIDAFVNMALQFELSLAGSPIFNIPRTSRH